VAREPLGSSPAGAVSPAAAARVVRWRYIEGSARVGTASDATGKECIAVHRSAADDEGTRSTPPIALAEAGDAAARETLSRQARLIAMLRHQAKLHESDVAALRERLESAEHELEDLRAIRDALTPPEVPRRPGLDIAARFLPAAEHVGGDFYLVAAGPRDATVLVVGDVVGHGLAAARRAAFVRTIFVATAPFSDDPVQLLRWVNAALIERAGTTHDFVTAACATFLPGERRLRWAYAGHPPALRLDDGRELAAGRQGAPLGLYVDPECVERAQHAAPGDGVLLYTDGLTEARHDDGRLLGVDAVGATLRELDGHSPGQVVATLSSQARQFASGELDDDLCLLAARMS
jgi:serine phosphatase RsbU (regulator of sigma subunit)